MAYWTKHGLCCSTDYKDIAAFNVSLLHRPTRIFLAIKGHAFIIENLTAESWQEMRAGRDRESPAGVKLGTLQIHQGQHPEATRTHHTDLSLSNL